MQHLHAFVTLCAWVLYIAPLAAQETNAAETLSMRDGDRVVFLGNTFFERALDYGHLETSLTLRWPEKKITFRNLGWDGGLFDPYSGGMMGGYGGGENHQTAASADARLPTRASVSSRVLLQRPGCGSACSESDYSGNEEEDQV